MGKDIGVVEKVWKADHTFTGKSALASLMFPSYLAMCLAIIGYVGNLFFFFPLSRQLFFGKLIIAIVVYIVGHFSLYGGKYF